MNIGLQDRVVVRGEVLGTEAGGETVLFDPESGNYFTFEGVGSRIWRSLGQPVQVAELCRQLVREYDAPEEEIQASTLAFLNDIGARRLVSIL